MGRIIVFFSLCFLQIPAFANRELVGHWRFVSTKYKGEEHPRPNPDLNLFYDFDTGGTNKLSWTRNGIPGFCERTARYVAGDGVLVQWIVWVDPKNNGDCAADPDMEWGRSIRSAYRIQSEKLETDLMAGQEILTYVWQREAVPMIR